MNIRDYCGLPYVRGEVGIEIEMEGNNLFVAPRKWWRYAHDGSLRGNSLEWVLLEPLPREEIQAALDYLVFNSKDSDLHPSDRCGVHVHINVQDLSIRQMFVFAMLYLILEPLLMKWCGEDREGNLFCLRSGDAEGLILSMREALEMGDLNVLNTDHLRYASLNFCALFKFGSLEFRGYGTPKNMMNIMKWVELLLAIKDASFRYRELPDLLEQLSGNGINQFMKNIFNEKQIRMLMHPDAEVDVYDAVRRLQDVAYCRRGFMNEYWDGKLAKDKPLRVKKQKLEHVPDGWQDVNGRDLAQLLNQLNPNREGQGQ